MRRHLFAILGSLVVLAGCVSGATSTSQTSEATAAPTAEPTTKATVEPTPEPTAEPTTEPAVEPTAEPTVEPTREPTTEPTVEPTAEPTPESTDVRDDEAAAETASGASGGTTDPEPVEADASAATSVEDLPPSTYTGDVKAIRTASGAVVAVRARTTNGFEVVTPCYNVLPVQGGLELVGPLDVLIDPGHGGDEPGAVGPNGLKESDVNLRVAELLRAELIARGYTVELTRYSDVRVAIQSRAELANALEPSVFLSVHHNGGYPESFPVAGTEVFVQLDDPESQRLGGLVFEEIQKAFAGTTIDWMGSPETFGVAWRQNQEGTDLYGVLRRTPELVTVLTEAMFISTEAEAQLLAKPETLEIEALALAEAVDRWFETKDLGSGHIEGVVFEGDLGDGGGTDGCVDPAL